MFAFLFGLAWLILTPVCVWLLFGRGHKAALRAAAVAVLSALQVGTLAVGFANRSATSTAGPPAARSQPAAAPALGNAAAQGAGPCQDRTLTPEAVRLRRSGAALNITVFWKAGTSRCDTATVTLRPSGRRIGILLREGPPTHPETAGEGAAGRNTASGGREETHTAPTRVAHGMASLRLRFTPRQHNHKRYVAVDINTGDRISQLRAEKQP